MDRRQAKLWLEVLKYIEEYSKKGKLYKLFDPAKLDKLIHKLVN